MAECELCGSNRELVIVLIENTKLKVCENCSKFGKVLSVPQPRLMEKKRRDKPEEIKIIVNDYSKLIKNAREKLNLKQEELAKDISEKVSIIHAIESGHSEPNINLAKKLERVLNIRLVENIKEFYIGKKESKSKGLTIGDIIKIKDE